MPLKILSQYYHLFLTVKILFILVMIDSEVLKLNMKYVMIFFLFIQYSNIYSTM